ncbi:hypothetical protein LTR99_003717 [Exophiala xenobiotica]|uniref:Uncharacterized protein n=1 Tax=Vermiconidia calcicola TaxID=1690605 RepID=A0AAV9PY51_9PEZI|nr:hypothetical protein LTR47_010482 [Exophiala xenobiotica]KAK5531410.1 hypothetical protein LTR25_008519 [Vermiconidia calcicola]KAK5544803.1 hypothetical protein LTR23_004243 [Chaetothyriales sp. CCFEE 6169]KAK5243458.1 hypothetical protein LTS06_010783 [Exophiala xenobiotica]KAK5304652.1 hypothetical protein LTR99_003717 [Exophiala xenobiotica]
MLFFALLLFWAVAFGVPLPSGNHSAMVNRNGLDFDPSLYKGLDWSKAIIDCNQDQLNILQRATDIAVFQMLAPTAQAAAIEPMWDWFFRGYKGWVSNPQGTVIANRIQRNLEYPYNFVLNGKKADNTDVKKFPLVYTCKDSRRQVEDGICRPGVGAYTVTPRDSIYDTWTITFCDDFFNKLNYAEKLWGPAVYRNPTPPDLNSRRTFEDAIIHEYFHVSGMGFANYVQPTPDQPVIIDVQTEIGGTKQLIYGATLANKFAYKNPDSTNADTAINADSYALLLLGQYVNKIYGGIWKKETRWNAVDPNGAGIRPPGGMVGGMAVGGIPTDNTTDLSGQIGNMTVKNNMTIAES